MIITPSVSSFAAVVIAASMSFTANVMPVATGAPSHAEGGVRVTSQRPSAVESTRGQISAVETRNGGAPSVASNLGGRRDDGMGNLPVGAMILHREGLPSMTDSREGEVSALR